MDQQIAPRVLRVLAASVDGVVLVMGVYTLGTGV